MTRDECSNDKGTNDRKSLGSFLSEDTISKAIILFSTLLCFVPFSEILIGFTSIQIVNIGLKQFNLYDDIM